MKRNWFAAGCGVVMASAMWVAQVSADEPSAPPNPVPAPGAAVAKEVTAQTLCPVMKEPINKQFFVDYEGKRIYTCCPMCIKTIKQDPAKYVKMLEDQGITLAKAEPAAAAKPQAPADETPAK